MDAMIDLETLGTTVKAPIMQIGVCIFEPTGDPNEDLESLKINVDPQSCMDLGAVPDWSTLQWWSAQPNVGEMFSIETLRLSIGTSLQLLNDYLQGSMVAHVWANSPSFDLKILENMYSACGMEPHWDHRMERDYRTLKAMNQSNPCPYKFIGQKHDAAYDAIDQAKRVKYWVGGHIIATASIILDADQVGTLMDDRPLKNGGADELFDAYERRMLKKAEGPKFTTDDRGRVQVEKVKISIGCEECNYTGYVTDDDGPGQMLCMCNNSTSHPVSV